MIVDDSFGSSKCTHTSSPGSLFWLLLLSTGAFKIRSKKQIGSAGVETVKERNAASEETIKWSSRVDYY